MLSKFTIKEFQPNSVLLKQGEMASEIYIIMLGEVQILG